MSLLSKIKKLFKKEEKAESKPEKKSYSEKNDRPRKSNNRRSKPRSQDRPQSKPKPAYKDRREDKPRDLKEVTPKAEEKPKVEEKPKPKPVPFSDLPLHPKLLEKLKANNFIDATEVQSKSIPFTLSGKNIFCSSETGSGKTLSFLIPMIHKIYSKELDQALVVCPTREIATQIQKTLQLFEDDSEELTSALVIGGTNVEAQKKALMKYPKILVATPGRLLDMLDTGLIWLNYTGYVVLDEADRMLDMGFEEDLLRIHKQLSGEHQTILFSATLFPEIKKMAKHYASDYEEIVIGSPTSVAGTVEHVLVEMDDKDKFFALKYFIQRNPGKMMVFFNTIRETTDITQQLRRQRISKIACIHSKIDQSDRERVIENFKTNVITALLASDVASRGIDIPNVELVINFGLPGNREEYIHRVGRTGRAGNKGVAISFYTSRDKKKLKDIEDLLEGKIKRVSDYRDILGGGDTRRSDNRRSYNNRRPRHNSNNRSSNGEYKSRRYKKPDSE